MTLKISFDRHTRKKNVNCYPDYKYTFINRKTKKNILGLNKQHIFPGGYYNKKGPEIIRPKPALRKSILLHQHARCSADGGCIGCGDVGINVHYVHICLYTHFTAWCVLHFLPVKRCDGYFA
jgi:hypothetical protein